MTHYEDMMQKMTVEGMASLIARQPCARCIWENEDCNDKSCAEGIEKWLMEEKEIKVQGEIHAHWMPYEYEIEDGSKTYKCSHCGEEQRLIDGTPKDNGWLYCPKCGAKQRWIPNA